MDPRLLQSQIHANYSTGSGVWADFRTGVAGLFAQESGSNFSDYRDHLIREFNRKINDLNQPSGLFISPFDNGFRFTGSGISGITPPPPTPTPTPTPSSFEWSGATTCGNAIGATAYTAEDSLSLGATLYANSALTLPYTEVDSIFVYNGTVYEVNFYSEIISIRACLSSSYTVYSDCSLSGPPITVYSADGLSLGNAVYNDAERISPFINTSFSDGSTIFGTDSNGIINSTSACPITPTPPPPTPTPTPPPTPTPTPS